MTGLKQLGGGCWLMLMKRDRGEDWINNLLHFRSSTSILHPLPWIRLPNVLLFPFICCWMLLVDTEDFNALKRWILFVRSSCSFSIRGLSLISLLDRVVMQIQSAQRLNYIFREHVLFSDHRPAALAPLTRRRGKCWCSRIARNCALHTLKPKSIPGRIHRVHMTDCDCLLEAVRGWTV